MEGLFIKNERVQGGMGIFALLFFLSLPRNRGERAARRRRPGPAARDAMAAMEWGKERGRLVGSIPPLDFREGGLQGGEPWRRAAAGGDGRSDAVAGLDGGPELGEKGKGTSGFLLRPLPRAEVTQGGGSAVVGEARRLWRAVAALGARGGGQRWRSALRWWGSGVGAYL